MSDSDIDPRLGPWEPVTTERLRQLLFPNGPLAWSDGESEQSPASNGVLHQYVDEFEISSSFDGNPWEVSGILLICSTVPWMQIRGHLEGGTKFIDCHRCPVNIRYLCLEKFSFNASRISQ
jgi:hypothetical protein